MGADVNALEEQVSRLAKVENGRGPCRSLRRDREYSRLLTLLRPRIGHLVRRYGLADMAEDAMQASAIGVHRAVQTYDATKSRFTTHVTWQIRGELQSLRHRLRLDQRRSARTAGMRTVSLDALERRDGGDGRTFEIVDRDAEDRLERPAADAMTRAMLEALMVRIGSPENEQAIVLAALFDRDEGALAHGKTREQRRQIVRRTFRNCAKLVCEQPLAASG